MTINETMQSLHEMIGIIELKAPLDSKDTLHCQTGYSPVEWCINRQHGASTLVTIHEAQNHICMAAIEWLDKKVLRLRIQSGRVDGGRWMIQIEYRDECVTHAVFGDTPFEALYAAVKMVKESKDDNK